MADAEIGLRYHVFKPPLTGRYGESANFYMPIGSLILPSLAGAQKSGRTAGIWTDYRDLARVLGCGDFTTQNCGRAEVWG